MWERGWPTMAPEDLLLAARDVMRERGISFLTFQAPDGSVCLEGALNLAASGNATRPCSNWDARVSLNDECKKRFGRGIAPSNDWCVAGVDEACDVLEAAAKRAARKGVADE